MAIGFPIFFVGVYVDNVVFIIIGALLAAAGIIAGRVIPVIRGQ